MSASMVRRPGSPKFYANRQDEGPNQMALQQFRLRDRWPRFHVNKPIKSSLSKWNILFQLTQGVCILPVGFASSQGELLIAR